MDIAVEEIRRILDGLKELSEEQQRINERTGSLHERLTQHMYGTFLTI